MTIKQRPKTLGPQNRALNLRSDSGGQVDAEQRTLRFPFSSEEPVDMWYGTETLSHSPGAMRNGGRQQTLPLLFNHNRDDLIGIVESIEIGSDRRGYCTVRFGRDARGDWAMQQVADDVLVNASFMYRVFTFDEDVDQELFTATDWEPYEISLVTVPADASVGVSRATSQDENAVRILPGRFHTKGKNMDHQGNNSDQQLTRSQRAAAQKTATVEATAVEVERARVAEIDAMCRTHKIDDNFRNQLIQDGSSIEEARSATYAVLLKRNKTSSTYDFQHDDEIGMTDAEIGRFSIVRAILAHVSNDWSKAGFEREACRTQAQHIGKESPGFFVPREVMSKTAWGQRAAYNTGATGTGGAMVATNLMGDAFIDALRNQAQVLAAGATVLSGLVGNVNIPRQAGVTSTFWVTETGALTEAEASFDKVSLTPKTIGTLSAISRQMLIQSTPAIELIVRKDILAQLGLGIDLAALSGAGSGGVPKGILNTNGISTLVGGTNGAQISIDHALQMEAALNGANAPTEGRAYMFNAKTISWLKGLKASTGQYLWTDDAGQRSGTPRNLNGYPVLATNQLRSNLTKGTSSGVCSEACFGAWPDLLFGEWGILEILPNPYDATLYPQGGILLRAMQSVDVGVRHPASFVWMSDALTA